MNAMQLFFVISTMMLGVHLADARDLRERRSIDVEMTDEWPAPCLPVHQPLFASSVIAADPLDDFVSSLLIADEERRQNNNAQAGISQAGGNNNNAQAGISQQRRAAARRQNANAQSGVQQSGGNNNNVQSGVKQNGAGPAPASLAAYVQSRRAPSPFSLASSIYP